MIIKASVLRSLMIAAGERRNQLRRQMAELSKNNRFEAGRIIKEINEIDRMLDVCHEVLKEIKFGGKVFIEEG